MSSPGWEDDDDGSTDIDPFRISLSAFESVAQMFIVILSGVIISRKGLMTRNDAVTFFFNFSVSTLFPIYTTTLMYIYIYALSYEASRKKNRRFQMMIGNLLTYDDDVNSVFADFLLMIFSLSLSLTHKSTWSCDDWKFTDVRRMTM